MGVVCGDVVIPDEEALRQRIAELLELDEEPMTKEELESQGLDGRITYQGHRIPSFRQALSDLDFLMHLWPPQDLDVAELFEEMIWRWTKSLNIDFREALTEDSSFDAQLLVGHYIGMRLLWRDSSELCDAIALEELGHELESMIGQE